MFSSTKVRNYNVSLFFFLLFISFFFQLMYLQDFYNSKQSLLFSVLSACFIEIVNNRINLKSYRVLLDHGEPQPKTPILNATLSYNKR